MNEGNIEGQREAIDLAKCICSFCGKSHKEVSRLIAGPNDVYICGACVGICNNILSQPDPIASDSTPENA